MQLRRWNELPGVMRTREVRKYYNIIKKRQMSLKIKRLFDIVVASIMLMFLAVPMLVIAVFPYALIFLSGIADSDRSSGGVELCKQKNSM